MSSVHRTNPEVCGVLTPAVSLETAYSVRPGPIAHSGVFTVTVPRLAIGRGRWRIVRTIALDGSEWDVVYDTPDHATPGCGYPCGHGLVVAINATAPIRHVFGELIDWEPDPVALAHVPAGALAPFLESPVDAVRHAALQALAFAQGGGVAPTRALSPSSLPGSSSTG